MGETFKVNSLEEMCDMMCDNVVPKEKKKWYYFTFGCGQKHAGHYVKIFGTFDSTRKKMFEKYGRAWGFQYAEEDWEEFVRKYPDFAETLLEVVE